MSTDERRRRVCDVQDRIEKYEYVLKALVVLDHKFCILRNAVVWQGKKLYTSSASADGSGGKGKATPDMAVEAAGRGHLYRAVVEIKGSISKHPGHLSKVISQLEKYKLITGNWENTAPDVSHDVILVAGTPHADNFVAQIKNIPGRSGIKNWLIVIRVVAAKHNGEECMEIARIYGQIGHTRLDASMSPEKACRIPLYKIIKKIDQLKFYDSDPPVEYTMTVMWDHIFSKFVQGKNLQKLRDGQKVTISISMDQIKKRIKAFAPRTNSDCVNQSWVNDAISKFKEINVVFDGADGSFTVNYKKHKMPTTEWIVDKIAKIRKPGTGARRSKKSSGSSRLDGYL